MKGRALVVAPDDDQVGGPGRASDQIGRETHFAAPFGSVRTEVREFAESRPRRLHIANGAVSQQGQSFADHGAACIRAAEISLGHASRQADKARVQTAGQIDGQGYALVAFHTPINVDK